MSILSRCGSVAKHFRIFCRTALDKGRGAVCLCGMQAEEMSHHEPAALPQNTVLSKWPLKWLDFLVKVPRCHALSQRSKKYNSLIINDDNKMNSKVQAWHFGTFSYQLNTL